MKCAGRAGYFFLSANSPGADQKKVRFAVYPDRRAVRRAMGHQCRDVSEVWTVNQLFHFVRQRISHRASFAHNVRNVFARPVGALASNFGSLPKSEPTRFMSRTRPIETEFRRKYLALPLALPQGTSSDLPSKLSSQAISPPAASPDHGPRVPVLYSWNIVSAPSTASTGERNGPRIIPPCSGMYQPSPRPFEDPS